MAFLEEFLVFMASLSLTGLLLFATSHGPHHPFTTKGETPEPCANSSAGTCQRVNSTIMIGLFFGSGICLHAGAPDALKCVALPASRQMIPPSPDVSGHVWGTARLLSSAISGCRRFGHQEFPLMMEWQYASAPTQHDVEQGNQVRWTNLGNNRLSCRMPTLQPARITLLHTPHAARLARMPAVCGR